VRLRLQRYEIFAKQPNICFFFSAPPRRLKRSKGIEAATFVSELARRVSKSAKSFQNQQKFAFCCLKVWLFKKIHLSLQKITLIILILFNLKTI